MDTIYHQLNHLELRVEDIQYLPYHRCPQCAAPPRTTENGVWLRPYQDWFGTALSSWLDHLGYACFQCDCRYHTQLRGSLRVARLGDAILPMQFDDGTVARQLGLEPALINADRVHQAVTFLAEHADPAFTAGSDWLSHTLCALASGGVSPEGVRRDIQRWIAWQVEIRLHRAQVAQPASELVGFDLGSRLTER
jgi:hypothetical protein